VSISSVGGANAAQTSFMLQLACPCPTTGSLSERMRLGLVVRDVQPIVNQQTLLISVQT
jgi:hypothetical protein